MIQRLALAVGEAARLLGISRSHAYELVRRGELPSLRLGHRIVVPRAAVQRLLGEELAVPSSEAPRSRASAESVGRVIPWQPRAATIMTQEKPR